jgi:hypothetical protein
LPRKRDIEAAVAAYNATDPEALLPPEVARLLAVMFRRDSVCQRSLDDLAAEGFDRRSVSRLLRALVEAGFLVEGAKSWPRPQHLPPAPTAAEAAMKGPRLPTDRPRRDEITAVVAAHDQANKLAPPLPRNAARLLAAMFIAGDLYQRSLENIAALGFSRKHLPGTLQRLVNAGFMSRERGLGHTPSTYHLHLRPRRQP